MKITKSQLVQIIKEEAENFKKELKLKKELAEIERQLNEVHANGEMSSTKNDGVHAGQKEPIFKKNGSHLIEVEDEEQVDKESLMAALKTIASACGLTGTIELGDEEGEEEDEEGEVDVDVVEPEGGEESEEEGSEEEFEEVEMEEGEMEEGEMEEGEMEEGVKEEGEMEEGEIEEEGKVIKESVEKSRMMQLAGLKK